MDAAVHLLLDQLRLQSCRSRVCREGLHVLYVGLVLLWTLALHSTCMLVHVRAASTVLAYHVATSVNIESGANAVIEPVGTWLKYLLVTHRVLGDQSNGHETVTIAGNVVGGLVWNDSTLCRSVRAVAYLGDGARLLLIGEGALGCDRLVAIFACA